MLLSHDHTQRADAPTLDRVDPYWRAPLAAARVTVTGRVGQGRRATVKGTSWRALMDDSAPALLRKVRTAAALELRADRDAPRVVDAADEVYLALLESARAETGGATDWPRTAQTRMMLLRLKVRQYRRDHLDRRMAEMSGTAGADWDTLAEEVPAMPEPDARELDPRAAERAARDCCAMLGLSSEGPVFTLAYDALRGAPGETVAAELEVSLDALKGQCKRARVLLTATYPDPRSLMAALALIDAPAAPRKDHGAADISPDWRDDARAIPAPVLPNLSAPLGGNVGQMRWDIGTADYETTQHARTVIGAGALGTVERVHIDWNARTGQLALSL